ncbi:class I SAM-dependent methyltransferase [Nakamurella sp. PAMC28650]|uniref:class I SAM-dependent methyltransferase n=1 Tax=Nakamurella sp. PAMC28650 TaxID=2762325 RepID=UPI00164D7822|nr:methyltransferase domain-containing protein [Nakamurella sp. PAMC28650]QNK81861.1 methyltransferase domain-containing protein [Nakamurella sp. PAMC28650]
MTSSKGVAGVFDRAADTYDTVGVPWFGPIAAGLVEELDVHPGERVLDVGTGRGALLVPLAVATGPTGRVVGIDLAPRMVALTAQDVHDLPQAEVRVGDATAPGLPAGSLDVVAASLVLFFLPDPVAAVRTWVDLLVTGGRSGVSTFGPQDERWAHVDEIFGPYLAPGLMDARTSGRRGPFASDDGVAQILLDGGLSQVRTVHRDTVARFRDADHLLEFSWSHGQRVMWESVPEQERTRVRDRYLAAADEVADPGGGITFTQVARYTLGVKG